jgi:hypothetical protein
MKVSQMIWEQEAARVGLRRTAAPALVFWLQLFVFVGAAFVAWIERGRVRRQVIDFVAAEPGATADRPRD